MKARYIFLALLATSLGFASCSDDDDKEPTYQKAPDPIAPTELTVDVDTLEVGVGETASFNITAGGGNYKIINENPSIATAELTGTTVTVSSQEKGWSGIIVSDADGNYKRVTLRSLYKQLVIDNENVTVGIKLGHTDGSARVTITGGNDGYTAESADENVARVSSVNGNVITIAAVAQGTTTVTITDMMGVTKTVTVTVNVTTIPFTDDEKADIMSLTGNTVSWDVNTSYNWGTFAATEENGQQKVYWNYYNYYFINVFFDGDLSVGKKTNGRVEKKFSWSGNADVFDDVTVEILKNDNSRLWGIMSQVGTKDGKDYLYTGYFCVGL